MNHSRRGPGAWVQGLMHEREPVTGYRTRRRYGRVVPVRPLGFPTDEDSRVLAGSDRRETSTPKRFGPRRQGRVLMPVQRRSSARGVGREFSFAWEVCPNAVWRFGRVLMHCPRCARRTTRLYVATSNGWLACRRCWGPSNLWRARWFLEGRRDRAVARAHRREDPRAKPALLALREREPANPACIELQLVAGSPSSTGMVVAVLPNCSSRTPKRCSVGYAMATPCRPSRFGIFVRRMPAPSQLLKKREGGETWLSGFDAQCVNVTLPDPSPHPR
jgi:hypothetical protein